MKRLNKIANFNRDEIEKVIWACLFENIAFDPESDLQVSISDDGNISWKIKLSARVPDIPELTDTTISIGGWYQNEPYDPMLFSIEATMYIEVTNENYKTEIYPEFWYPFTDAMDYEAADVYDIQDIMNIIIADENLEINEQELKQAPNDILGYFQPAINNYCEEWYEEIITKINQRLKDADRELLK